MARYPYALTNPGGELNNTTGWTARSGGAISLRNSGDDVAAFSGAKYFAATASGATAKWDQQVAVNAAHYTAVDTGTMILRGLAPHIGYDQDTDSGQLYVECYAADGTTLLGRQENAASDPAVWTYEAVQMTVPTGTRFFRIGTNNTRVTGTQLSTYWDEFSLELADAGTVFPPQARLTSLRAEAIVTPAANARVTSLRAEAIVKPVAQARVTRLYVEVLRSVGSVASGRRRELMIS